MAKINIVFHNYSDPNSEPTVLTFSDTVLAKAKREILRSGGYRVIRSTERKQLRIEFNKRTNSFYMKYRAVVGYYEARDALKSLNPKVAQGAYCKLYGFQDTYGRVWKVNKTTFRVSYAGNSDAPFNLKPEVTTPVEKFFKAGTNKFLVLIHPNDIEYLSAMQSFIKPNTDDIREVLANLPPVPTVI